MKSFLAALALAAADTRIGDAVGENVHVVK